MRVIFRKRINIFLIIGLLLWATLCAAVPVSELYLASVPVADQAVTTREANLPQALLQVLIKLTGNNQLAQQPALRKELTHAAQWLQEYSYVTLPQLDQQPAQLLLQAHFAIQPVNQLLQKLQVSVWGRTRPVVLMWLAVPQFNQTTIVSGDTQTWSAYLNWQAQRRGVPLLLPNLDLTDLNQITATDISNFNLNALRQVASRYKCDVIVAGQLVQAAAQQWRLQWQLILPEQVQSYQLAGVNQAAVLTQLFDDLADKLVKIYATPISVQEAAIDKVTLVITQINDLNDYNDVIRYLKRLSQVRQLQLVKFSANTMTFELQLNTTIAGLKQALALDRQLTAVKNQSQNDMLYYQWIL